MPRHGPLTFKYQYKYMAQYILYMYTYMYTVRLRPCMAHQCQKWISAVVSARSSTHNLNALRILTFVTKKSRKVH